MSLRDGGFPSKQSPAQRGDCFAKCARNDMQTASLRELQSATGEGLRRRRTLLQSVPVLSEVEGLDRAFKGEL